MWELDHKEGWTLKNCCFWTVVLEKTLQSPLDCKEIKPVNSKGNQSWMFIGRTDVEAEVPILWPTDAKNWLIWKDPDAGKDEGRRRGRQRMRWHHRLSGHEFEQALGDGEGQRSLACCSPWGRKDLDMTGWLNNFLLGFPGWVVVKNLPANAGDKKDPGVIAESERFPGIGNGNPFQYSCLENSIDRGVWWSSVHGVANSWTPRSD